MKQYKGASPPAPERPQRAWGLPAAIFVLALCVAGGAAAIALSQQQQPASEGVAVVTDKSKRVEGGQRAADARAAQESPQVSVTRMLRRYYDAVHAGDFETAWGLLSPTYKSWKASNGGRAKWQTLEEDNQAYLDPGTLDVEIVEVDRESGVATVRVTGMTYTRPGDSPCAYEGVTWVRKSGSTWVYDQGYLQDPERAAKWRPRRAATLGYSCTPSGY